jgi:phosphoglycolate phosphatase
MLHIIWDLDGTLIDSEREILYTFELAVTNAGFSMSDCIKPVRIGPPLEILLLDVFPKGLINKEQTDEIITQFRKRYDSSDYSMTDLFPGIDNIIADTNHFIHHVVTNKPKLPTNRILEKLGLLNSFASIMTPDFFQDSTNVGKKSKAELFAYIINQYKNEDLLIVGIGDTQNDCIAAKKNNIPTIGVLWGAGTREELASCCDYLFDGTEQLYSFLYSLCNTREMK